MDVLEIDGASHTGVDDVRNLIDAVAYRPSVGARNVYIVDEVHMLSTAAFNALLKTLEEPPRHALFLFATTEIEKIPATILSRVQRLELKRINESEIVSNLQGICEQEEIQYEASSLQQIAVAADGSLRDAQTLMEQMILLSGEKVVSQSIADQFLGSIGPDKEVALLELIAHKDQTALLSQLSGFHEKGKDLLVLANRLLKWCRACLISKSTKDWNLLSAEFDGNLLKRLEKAFEKWTIEDIDRLFEILWTANERLRRSDQALIVLEIALLRACRMTSSLDLRDLLDRLDELSIAQAQGTGLPAPDTAVPSSRPHQPSMPKKKSQARSAAQEKPIEKQRFETSDQLLEALRGAKPSLYTLALCAQKRELKSGVWSLCYPQNHFAYRQISEPLIQKELKTFLSEASENPIDFKVIGIEGAGPQKASEKNFIQSAKKEILSDPDLQQIASELNGRVSEVTIEGIKT